jgi:hypothetical protein
VTVPGRVDDGRPIRPSIGNVENDDAALIERLNSAQTPFTK